MQKKLNQLRREELKRFLEKADNQQNIGPFPLRDSGILAEMHSQLEMNLVGPDDEPVVACPVCKHIHLKEIDGKLECFNCGRSISSSSFIVYSSIKNYLEHESS